ncbi:MAG: polysaccharide pyruvyl transferase family protein [Bacteroidales bacterium]|nr:polysaccharide pyruvyl transferase family protein [Bacteroidales bacterium]
MLRKIGILTFHASHNYGSMLQAYALQTCLERLGCDVTIINYRSFAQKHFYVRPDRQWVKPFLRAFLTHPHVFLQGIGKWKKFERFMQDKLHLSRELSGVVDVERFIRREPRLFEAVITGGDQIWNLGCTDVSPVFFLPFETPGVRRISYSVSLGDGNWWNPTHYAHFLKALVSGYDYPSIREKTDAVLLSDLLMRPVDVVPDPVFLLEKEDYERLAGDKPRVKGRYIFYYCPQFGRESASIVATYAKERGINVVTSNKHLAREERGFISCSNAGPVEFLNLLKNASLVCGHSLHLVALAILLHKPFRAISGTKDSRIANLLDAVGLSSCYLMTVSSSGSIDPFSRSFDFPPIDWSAVDTKLGTLRQAGLAFLKRALGGEG